ncbi:MAG: hypothetical protein KGJ11_07585, partial [Candidatus Omnitrophica bacterium]|nr:hypothetical protein [Candidatus Omnitrophota bacterium]
MFLNNPLNVQQLIGFCLILFGGTLFLIKPVFGTRTRVQENALIGILLLCSILATAYYLNFGQLRVFGKYGAQNYHPEEIFGQYIGSKYFRETGYYDLYACASVAIQEMKAETPRQPTPNLFTINDLTGKQYLLTPSEVMAQYQGQCHDRFSGERWKEFKGDLRTMFDINMSDFWWRVTLSDVGYSSSPVYSTIIGKIANLLPLSHCWKWLGYIDIFLYALSAFFIWRTFGLYPLIGLLLIFGTNELSNYAWTAGSFFRATWFTCLAIALCLLKNKKFFWAGVLFAAASADRGFPLLFFIGALAPLANDWFESR